MSSFGPGGSEVGPETGLGIWDANSWGQHIGGTSHAKGRDIGFSDPTHISGQVHKNIIHYHSSSNNKTNSYAYLLCKEKLAIQ